MAGVDEYLDTFTARIPSSDRTNIVLDFTRGTLYVFNTPEESFIFSMLQQAPRCLLIAAKGLENVFEPPFAFTFVANIVLLYTLPPYGVTVYTPEERQSAPSTIEQAANRLWAQARDGKKELVRQFVTLFIAGIIDLLVCSIGFVSYKKTIL